MSSRKSGGTRKAVAPSAVPHIELTAFHEAGHAVIAHEFERPIIKVTINPDENTWGQMVNERLGKSFRPDIYTGVRTRDRLEREVIIFLAGNAAESLRAGREIRTGAHHDFAHAMDLALFVCGSDDETEAYLNWLWIRTRNLVRRPLTWTLISALANELLSKREMTGTEVEEFLKVVQGKALSGEIEIAPKPPHLPPRRRRSTR